MREIFRIAVFIKRTALIISVLWVAVPRLRAVDIQKDDQILFVRDEPLLLYGQPAATAKKGQVYTVLTYQPAERRVYLLAKDAAGQAVSLNAPDFAVVLLPGRGEPAFQRGLNFLKLGRWPEALRELAAASAAEPAAPIYEQAKTAVDTVLDAQRGVQQAAAAVEKAAQLSAVQRRNADITAQANSLFPDDHSNLAKAMAIRRTAEMIDAGAKAGLEAARKTLDDSGVAFDAALRAASDAHASDAVLALLAARDRLLPGRPPDTLGDLAHADLAALHDLVASAADATDAAARDLAANRLFAADHAAAGGLVALPTDRALKALQMHVQLRLVAVRDHLSEVDAAEKATDYAGALRLVNALLTESIDDPVLLARKTALEAHLAAS